MSGRRKKKKKRRNKVSFTGPSENDNCSEKAVVNFLLKGMVFVQETDRQTSIEHFMTEHPEKYNFLLANDRDDYKVIYQGSSVEGLCIYNIKERDSQVYYGNLRFSRQFDFDIMYESKTNIITEDEFFNSAALFFDDISFEEWTNHEYCLHENEPYVMHNIKHGEDALSGFAGITQPACANCISDQEKKFGTFKGYEGRPMRVVEPLKEMLKFKNKYYTNTHPDVPCYEMFETSFNHNEYGDLCWSCKEKNIYDLKHNDQFRSTAFLDTVHFNGPSILTRFYMNNKGEEPISLPLFTESGVSTINLDNIFALRYPTEFLCYNWPLACYEFVTREKKSGWPNNLLVEKAVLAGCHIVPKRFTDKNTGKPKTWFKFGFQMRFGNKSWRVSFSAAEKVLANTMSLPQRKCFLLLKFLFNYTTLTLNEEANYEVYSMPSFLLKHVTFWTMENSNQLEWRTNNMLNCIRSVLNQFEMFLTSDGIIPHYFYGKQKNLLWDQANEKEKHSTIERYLGMVKKIRTVEWIVKAISSTISEPRKEAPMLDYQWNIYSAELRHEYLIDTFSKMVSCCAVENEKFIFSEPADNWNEQVVAHYDSMIRFATTGLKRYGAGVNREFVDRLFDEKGCLEQDNNYDLDKDEITTLHKSLNQMKMQVKNYARKPFGLSKRSIDFLFAGHINLYTYPNLIECMRDFKF